MSYTNRFKAELLGVRLETLKAHGAVSFEAAREMAQCARQRAGSTLAASVTCVAGPGAADSKPAGLVYIAIADAKGCDVKERQFLGERERVRLQASQMALDLIRRRLL